jgi:hypothetical protein
VHILVIPAMFVISMHIFILVFVPKHAGVYDIHAKGNVIRKFKSLEPCVMHASMSLSAQIHNTCLRCSKHRFGPGAVQFKTGYRACIR